MSRSLDTDITSSISSGNSHEIYNDISQAVSRCTYELVEIEFLGKSHPLPPGTNFLVDGKNIALSKAKLVQAFLVARQILFTYIKDCPDEEISELRNATAVILLMDPEHLTAANTRKRLIQRRKTTDDFESLLKQELFFVDSYLTSRLHRHTKSPTLWGHRRWLLEMSASKNMQRDVLEDLQSVVFVAAERHPRNYYAWSHTRWLTSMLACSANPLKMNDLSQIITVTKDWCLRHPNDTSGFSFLLFAISYSRSASVGDSGLSNIHSAVSKEVLGLALSFKWTHESVWVFLRTLVAESGTEVDKTVFLAAIEDLVKVCPEDHAILERANRWCSKYEHSPVFDSTSGE